MTNGVYLPTAFMYSSKFSLSQIFHFPHKSDAIFVTKLQWKIQWNVKKLLTAGDRDSKDSAVVTQNRSFCKRNREKERKEGIPRENNCDRERESGKREIKGTVWVRIYRTTKPKDRVTERGFFFLSSINVITSDIFFQINLSFWWLKGS